MSEPLIIVDLHPAYGGRLQFFSLGELETLIHDQREQWSWIQEASQEGSHRGEWRDVWSRFQTHWERIEARLDETAKAEPDAVARLIAELRADLRRFGPGDEPTESLLSSSVLGHWISEPDRPLGDRLTALCWLLLDRLPKDQLDVTLLSPRSGTGKLEIEHLNGRRASVIVEISGIAHGGAGALLATEAALADFVDRTNATVAQVSSEAEATRVSLAAQRARLGEIVEEGERSVATSVAAQREKLEENHKELLARQVRVEEELVRLEETYSTKLALAAPVAYWTKEHERNRDVATGWMAATLVVLGLVGISLVVVVYNLWDLKQREVSWLLSGVILAALALMLGTVRFLSKLWLSSQNLEMAYAEKMAITQTFLALLNEGKLKDEDRTIALATIFRSAVVDEREGLSATTTAEAFLRMGRGAGP